MIVGIYIDEKLLQHIDELARKENRSRSNMISTLITTALRDKHE